MRWDQPGSAPTLAGAHGLSAALCAELALENRWSHRGLLSSSAVLVALVNVLPAYLSSLTAGLPHSQQMQRMHF